MDEARQLMHHTRGGEGRVEATRGRQREAERGRGREAKEDIQGTRMGREGGSEGEKEGRQRENQEVEINERKRDVKER